MTGQTFLYYNKVVGKRQENSMLYPLRAELFGAKSVRWNEEKYHAAPPRPRRSEERSDRRILQHLLSAQPYITDKPQRSKPLRLQAVERR